MDWNRRVNWDQQYNWRKFGWRGALWCLATALVVAVLGGLIAPLLPMRRETFANVLAAVLGFLVGFVYERNSGPPAMLLLWSGIFAVGQRDRELPFLANLGWIALWWATPLAGFGLGYLMRRRRSTGSNGM